MYYHSFFIALGWFGWLTGLGETLFSASMSQSPLSSSDTIKMCGEKANEKQQWSSVHALLAL